MRNLIINTRAQWLRKTVGRNYTFARLKKAIEQSDMRPILLKECLLVFSEQTDNEPVRYQKLRKQFYREYEEELSESLGFNRHTTREKLQVTDPDAFLKRTLKLIRKRKVDSCSLPQLARILHQTCDIFTEKNGKKCSERTLLNKLNQLSAKSNK